MTLEERIETLEQKIETIGCAVVIGFLGAVIAISVILSALRDDVWK